MKFIKIILIFNQFAQTLFLGNAVTPFGRYTPYGSFSSMGFGRELQLGGPMPPDPWRRLVNHN